VAQWREDNGTFRKTVVRATETVELLVYAGSPIQLPGETEYFTPWAFVVERYPHGGGGGVVVAAGDRKAPSKTSFTYRKLQYSLTQAKTAGTRAFNKYCKTVK
jgi:hypothetical protein